MRAGLDSQQQRLPFSDLGHLIGRGETFERGREDLSIDRTAGLASFAVLARP